MPMIAVQIEPHGATRVFFDCRDVAADPMDERHITLAIEHSLALAGATDDAEDFLLMAA